MRKKSILIVEDDPIMRLGMVHFLRSEGYTVSECADGEAGLAAVVSRNFDLVVTDLRLPKQDGFAVLRKALSLSPRPGVVIVTAFAEVKSAVSAIKEGAFDYLAKPFSNEELQITLDRYFAFQRLADEVTHLRKTLREQKGFENMIGVSPTMMDVFDRVTAVASTDVPVLVLGESGTGKEMVANAIHGLSPRSDNAFVKINCAAIPETLFESELFGHERGAFTGATETRKGKFEYADGGTLFLDEIADIPLALQPKLLRVLDDQVITRLGGNRAIKVDVRSIYATSRNLKDLVSEGAFREDLYYRINVVPIQLPSLRERPEDIPFFIDHYFKAFKQKFGKPDLAMSSQAFDILLAHPYPGNVRELKHALEQAVVLARDNVISVRDLPPALTGFAEGEPCMHKQLPLEESIRCFERQKIMTALAETGGRKIEAAERLGISRKVLWKKLKEYDLEH